MFAEGGERQHATLDHGVVAAGAEFAQQCGVERGRHGG
jgi:hypothetical protein